MLISIPERQGKSRYAGPLGFPWLAVADIVVAGAHQGWSYWRTKQQIDQAKAVSGAPLASAKDKEAITQAVLKKLGHDTPKKDVEALVNTLLTGSPDDISQPPPSSLLEARLATLERRQQAQAAGGDSGIPIWAWLIMGVLGFMVVSKSGMLGGG